MYSIYDFGTMINDSGRTEAYTQALRAAVKPYSVVLDIGTGTGIFALLASQYGARKVYAIETNSSIDLARDIAKANGLIEKIEFIQGLSTNVSLPEKADIIISDLHGVMPLFRLHIPSIVDARERLLKSNGVLIPCEETIWLSLVEAEDLYMPFHKPWAENAYQLDMSLGQAIVTNTWRKAHLKSKQLLAKPQIWAILDYTSIENPNVSAQLKFTAARSGTAHGVTLWFDSVVAEGLGFTNAPDSPEHIYGNAFFPLSRAVAIDEGDEIVLKVTANLVGDDYIWNWDTKISGKSTLKANFKQSTFYFPSLSPKELAKRAGSYVPRLSEAAQLDLAVLELMNQGIPLSAIAEQMLSRFPTRFKNLQSALSYVGELSLKYSE